MNIIELKKLRKIWEIVEGVWRYNFMPRMVKLSPRSLMINLTYRCNSRCVMCNIWQMKPKHEVSLAKWREVMNDDIFRDIRTLTISGGEPILYQDFISAVKLFINSMPKLRRLVLNTNGFLPVRVEKEVIMVAKICRKKGIKLAVSVSLDGVGEVHDNLRRTKNGFNKASETIGRLNKIVTRFGLGVGVSSVVLRQNIGNYWEMKKWLAENKLNGGFQIVGFHENFLRNKESEGELDINSVVKESFLKILIDIRDSKKWWSVTRYYWEDMLAMYKNGLSRTTPCTFLKDDFVIDSLGDIYYCLSANPIGNFIKERRSVGEIYYDRQSVRFRQNLPKLACRNCNSGCNSANGIAFDAKRFMWYRLTGRLWPGKVLDVG